MLDYLVFEIESFLEVYFCNFSLQSHFGDVERKVERTAQSDRKISCLLHMYVCTNFNGDIVLF